MNRNRPAAYAIAALAFGAVPLPAVADPTPAPSAIATLVEQRRDIDRDIALAIWNHAEVGYKEAQSSALLQEQLRQAGFAVEAGVAGMPTAFVATAGSGKPVIGILAEFDALPGFSQSAAPERSPLSGRSSGHACGHHLFGAGSTSAAIAVGRWLAQTRTAGTIRLYGTPAEEGGAGKVYMARAGRFTDVDVVLHWHPSDANDASPNSSLANRSAKFRFHGASAHAAGAPEQGRSAVDGVEAMNFMVNQMREHVPQETRIHYVITSGGSAPNVVPEFAEVFYYVRHPDPRVLEEVWARALKTAEAGALGTGTRVEHEVIHGAYSLLPNHTLARIVDRELRAVGGVRYDDAEMQFARRLQETLVKQGRPLGSQEQVQPLRPRQEYGSTDVGDVSWLVPTVGLRTATWVPGTPAHSWQAVAAGGMSIGLKGMEVASKTLARSAAALYRDPQAIREARAEFEAARGAGFRYSPLLGDRDPPLTYRDPPSAGGAEP
jgi:aminobenzoyl-glutamate utilization protein B